MRFLIALVFISLSSFCFAEGIEEAPIVLSWISVLPPLITIALALILREVYLSLLIGILAGLVILAFPADGYTGFWTGFLDIPIYLQDALVNQDHISVILFTLFIGAMVAVIGKNGGMMALVKAISSKAKNSRSVQLSTWSLGLAIFFDDYANTLIVGKTMRPLTDKWKISREKLAYIVDSTAAPVASIAFITTWIGAELGYISDGLKNIPDGFEIIGSPYAVFFQSLQFSFYPILTVVFMFFLIWKGRDFGPMFTAEAKARKAVSAAAKENEEVGEVDSVEDNKEYLISALLPIIVMLITAISALLYTGYQSIGWNNTLPFFQNLASLVGDADAYTSLLWASFCGLVSAIGITLVLRTVDLRKTIDHALEGVKIVVPAIVILCLAWTLSTLTEELNTALYLAGLVEGWLSPHALPAVVFILAGLIAFATGSSWGTMSILYPMVLLTSWQLCLDAGFSVTMSIGIFSAVVSSVLAGSVLGDHCSPISDTTILSSLASDCDHMAHVRTQMPYALTVGGVSILVGLIPAGFGVPAYITFPLSILSLYLIVSYFGKRVVHSPQAS